MENNAPQGYELTANEKAQESEREGRLFFGAAWRVESPYLGGAPVLRAEFKDENEYVITTARRAGAGDHSEFYIQGFGRYGRVDAVANAAAGAELGAVVGQDRSKLNPVSDAQHG